MESGKKDRILEVAKKIFLEKGYKETKITDIAKAAGISPATIYLYFNGKKDLFDSLQIPEAEMCIRDSNRAMEAFLLNPRI